MCSNFFRCSNLALHISEKKNNEENIWNPRKQKKSAYWNQNYYKIGCVFFRRQNFSSHLHLKIFKKKKSHLKRFIFSRKERDFSFKIFYEAHEKFRFFQNFLKINWAEFFCYIPSLHKLAKPNRICTQDSFALLIIQKIATFI